MSVKATGNVLETWTLIMRGCKKGRILKQKMYQNKKRDTQWVETTGGAH